MSTITWINTGSISQDQIKTTEIIINYLEGYINSHLARPINWNVSLNVNPSVSTANGNSDYVFLMKDGTKNLWLTNGAYQSITGVEKSGFDSIINTNPKYLTDYFLDQTPETSNDAPLNNTDTVSIFMHEMIHSLAFIGWTSWSSYENSTTAFSAFDKYITTLNGKPYFNGENAKLAYGGLVPLSPGNVFHVGNDTDGRQLESDLMQGFTYFNYGRRTISDLDLAILADCGIGTIRNDILAGSILADNIAAGAGNDTIRASVGDDIIDGGAGLDSASIPLARSQGNVSFSTGGNMTLSSTSFGSDNLINIERIDFTDGDLIFDVTSALAPAAYRLYGGAFDRTPDEGGFRYWTQTLDSGVSLNRVAASFIVSKEFTDRYGTNVSNKAFVDALYMNVLDRPGEAAGVVYWNEVLDKNLADRADVLVSFTQLPEYVGLSMKDIENGYWVV